MGIFGRKKSRPKNVDTEAVARCCGAFFQLRTWEECRQLLADESLILLSDEAQTCFAAFDSAAEKELDRRLVPILSERRALLFECRLRGIEAAFASLPRFTRREVLAAVVQASTAQANSGDCAHVVEQSAALAEDSAREVVIFLLDEAQRKGQPEHLRQALDEVFETVRSVHGQPGDESTSLAGTASRILALARLQLERGFNAKTESSVPPEGMSAFESAAEAYDYLGYWRGAAEARRNLAFGYSDKHAYRTASEVLLEAAQGATRANHITLANRCVSRIGRNLVLAGQLPEAHQVLNDCLRAAQLSADHELLGVIQQWLLGLGVRMSDPAATAAMRELMNAFSSSEQ